MRNQLEGRLCLVKDKDGVKKAKIIKVFQKIGFAGHGEIYVSVVFENCGSIWYGDRSYKLEDIDLV